MTRKFGAARKAAKRPRSEAKPSEVWAPARADRRAKPIGQALALCAALCVIFAACGHYGPPVREHPETGGPAAQDSEQKHEHKPSMKEERDAR